MFANEGFISPNEKLITSVKLTSTNKTSKTVDMEIMVTSFPNQICWTEGLDTAGTPRCESSEIKKDNIYMEHNAINLFTISIVMRKLTIWEW